MERVIALLREKNHCLEKFYWVNEQELINFGGGNFDSVDAFYQAREKLLEQISCVDGMLDDESERASRGGTAVVSAPLNASPVTGKVYEQQRAEIAILLRTKDELVKSILAQDLQVIEYIEKEKSNIIRELRANKHAQKAVGAYASAERLRVLEGE